MPNEIRKECAKMFAEIKEDLGYIKGELKGIVNRLDRMNGSIAANTEKIEKHKTEYDKRLNRFDVIFGKWGAIMGAVIFVLASGFNFILEYLKKVF